MGAASEAGMGNCGQQRRLNSGVIVGHRRLGRGILAGAATELTGLDDFGDDEWREPFRILLADIENEAHLHLAGRLLTRFDILRSLVARLKMAEAEALNPEILERPVDAPIFITGMGRTGTSILHESLAQDPAFRATAGLGIALSVAATDCGARRRRSPDRQDRRRDRDVAGGGTRVPPDPRNVHRGSRRGCCRP